MDEVIDALSTRDMGQVIPEKNARHSTDSSSVGRTAAASETFSPDHEVLSLVHQIFRKPGQRHPKTVIFSGVDRGAGCSRIVASTGSMLASSGDLVCMLEVNFHSPSLAGLFGVASEQGLAEALTTQRSILEYAKPVGSSERLWLVPAGRVSSGSIDFLTTPRLQDCLKQLEQQFAVIIIDAPPTSCSETLDLGRLSDGVVLVLEGDRTRRDAAKAAAHQLRLSDITLLGAVLNKHSYPIPSKLYSRL